MMVTTGAADPSVPVIAVVHDCQVLDLAESMFASHDSPVDYIVTPTRVLRCDVVPARRRPTGIIWSLLSTEQISRIPILQHLRQREISLGKSALLAGERETHKDVGHDGGFGEASNVASANVAVQQTYDQPASTGADDEVGLKNVSNYRPECAESKPCNRRRRGKRLQHLF